MTHDCEWKPDRYGAGKRMLVLGCGRRPVRGATNHDRTKHGDWVDLWGDLERMPWRFEQDELEDGARMVTAGFDVILALDLLEHIGDVLGFVNECHATLAPGGLLVLRAGAWDNPASYIDPTHKHWFAEESMNFFDPATEIGQHYGAFYVDSLGRPLAPWRVEQVQRVNADARWPDRGDLEFKMRSL